MASSVCATCGRPVDEHERDVRYTLPDPVLDLPDRERTDGTWMSGPNANESVMLQIPGVGPFVRALLPVRLTGGYSVRFGVWVSIHPDDLQYAFKVWWSPEYANFRLRGVLANGIKPWGLLATPVEIRVLDENQSPWVTASDDADMRGVLAKEWDHDVVLAALPGAGGGAP